MDKIELGVTEGMDVISEILTTTWIAELSGIKYQCVSRSIKHTLNNGKPVYFKEEHVQPLNDMIENAVEMIGTIKLDDENYFDVLKVWSKRVKPTYLVEKQMGKTISWKKMHFSDIKKERYYGKFSEKELLEFQFAFREVAAKLASIRLVSDVK